MKRFDNEDYNLSNKIESHKQAPIVELSNLPEHAYNYTSHCAYVCSFINFSTSLLQQTYQLQHHEPTESKGICGVPCLATEQ
jgi:hypothetical protein